jgi:inosine-uridine nucleoside N-ribohydrolase
LNPVPASARRSQCRCSIDTDVASDDLVAIAFLFSSPRVEVRAVTVSGTGEAHCGPGVDVVLRLLERLDAPPIAVACGRETPIAGDHAFPDAWRTGADDGSGLALPAMSREPFAGDAVQLIGEATDAVDGLRVLTLGPMTNLADTLRCRPELARRLETVYAMGGALFVSGNVAFGGRADKGVAEWNVYVDPTAAQMVIDSGSQCASSASTARTRCRSPRSTRSPSGGRRPVRAPSCSRSCSPGIRS